MRRLTVCILILIVPAGWVSAADAPHFAADRPLDVKHIRLELAVDLPAKTVDGHARIEMAALRPVSSMTLDAVHFDLSGVRVRYGDGPSMACVCENDGRHLNLTLPRPLAAGDPITVEIDYGLRDPREGLSFFGPTRDEPDAPYVVWSQGQTTTNRYWVPCFDNPNERQTTEVLCTVAEPYIAVSNGRLLETVDHDDHTRTFHWLQDKPHVAYLITLAVGDFVSKTETWRGKPVTYYVRKKFEDRIDNSFGNTLAMLDFFSDKIGVEYAWDQYAQVCCYRFGGGMENTSATTLTETTLHDDRAHLDTSSDSLVSHEMAHQWWGDLLTCREWAHVWLNEGFASYFEALWAEHHDGPDEFAYNMYGKSRGAIGGGKDKPIVFRGYENNWNQFDARAYPKGAWVLHMIRRRLGDGLFWRCINTYCKRFMYKTVETVDLRKTIEDVTGRSFERFFYDWTERPGSPVVTVDYEWLADDNLASIKVRQTQEAEAFHFPLKIELRFGKDAKPVTLIKQITDKKESYLVPLSARPTMVRIDPEQTVLMELTEKKPRDLWIAQLSDEADPVARIRAAKHFGESDAEQDHKLLAERLAAEPFWAVQNEIAEALGKTGGDTAREALLANLHTKHPKARAAIVRALGKFDDEPAVVTALRDLIDKGDASYKVEAAAIGSYASLKPDGAADFLPTLLDRDSNNEIIRAAVLAGIGTQADAEAISQLIDWTQPDKPMPCRTAAIGALATLVLEANVPNDARDDVVELLIDRLKSSRINNKSRRLPMAAMSALGKIGNDARAALPVIDNIADRQNGRLSSMAKRIAKTIRKSAAPKTQLAELRDELDKMRKDNRSMTERLEKLEATAKAWSEAETLVGSTANEHTDHDPAVAGSSR